MSHQMQLLDLQTRHQALEKAINDASNHLSSDGLTIAELKRRKLKVKDEIEQLRHADKSLQSESLH